MLNLKDMSGIAPLSGLLSTGWLSQLSQVGLALLHAAQPQSKKPDTDLLLHSYYFLHAASHPLTEIILNLELSLQIPSASHRRQADYTHQALQQSYYLQQLFGLLRPNNQGDTHFYVKKALEEIIFIHHRPQSRQKVVSALNIPATLVLPGNQFYFQEAITCLIHNAVEAQAKSARNQLIWLVAHATSCEVKIYLGDAGPGMDWPTQQLIHFDGFSLKKQQTGKGVGFAKQVLEKQFAGKVVLSSCPHMGTVWMIRLPLKKPHAATAKHARYPKPRTV